MNDLLSNSSTSMSIIDALHICCTLIGIMDNDQTVQNLLVLANLRSNKILVCDMWSV